MANSADPDQLASSVCKCRVYPGSAGLGLKKEGRKLSCHFLVMRKKNTFSQYVHFDCCIQHCRDGWVHEA